MAKKQPTRKKPVRKKTNAPRGSHPSDMRRTRQIIERCYFWRYHEAEDQSEVIDHLAYRGPLPPQDTAAMRYSIRTQLDHTPFIWHCFSITYCRDHWGKPYTLFGFGESPNPIKVSSTLMGGLLDQTFNIAEENANTKHIVGRGVIFAPKTETFPDILRLARKHKGDLRLSESDLEQLKEWQNEPVRKVKIYDVLNEEELDVHDEIAAYLSND